MILSQERMMFMTLYSALPICFNSDRAGSNSSKEGMREGEASMRTEGAGQTSFLQAGGQLKLRLSWGRGRRKMDC